MKPKAETKIQNTGTPKEHKAFKGIQRHPIKILKPGTVDPTETLRLLRGQ